MPPAAGEVLDEKYQVERILGEGGMGYVVAAWHAQLERRVALKLLRPETLAEAAFVTRFEREARAAAKIKSEHVCRVLDVGLSAAHGPYMVMEYLEGNDLQSLLRRVGPRPVPQAITWILHASHAIAEAHGRGIVHRDLKPANLFLTDQPDGEPLVKVLDFGISKVIQASPEVVQNELTTTSMLMGSYAYMSPEQARNAKDVDGRADVWALGAILQKLLTGTTPFVADSPSAYIAKIVADPPTLLRDRCPDAPAELEAVILRCLEKDRDERFANIAELAAALLPFAPGTEALVRAIGRLCNAPLDRGRASSAAHGRPLPESIEGPADRSPAPGAGASPAKWAPVPKEAAATSDTPTKPFKIDDLLAQGRPGSSLHTTPTSAPGATPVSASGSTPWSSPGAHAPTASGPGAMARLPIVGPTAPTAQLAAQPPFAPPAVPQPHPESAAYPAMGGLPAAHAPQTGTTDASVAPWTPSSPANVARPPRLALWLAISGAALALTVTIVVWVGLSASSPPPASAASGASPGPADSSAPAPPAAAGDESASSEPLLDPEPPRPAAAQDPADGAATAASASDGASTTASTTASASATAKPQPTARPTGKWDPFAHP